MSQLTGDTRFDLGVGLSWNAAIEIRRNFQQRRKVILDIANVGNNAPRITVQLDLLDRLLLLVQDRNGKIYRTPPIAPENFVDNFVWIGVEIFPSKSERENNKNIELTFQIAINGEVLSTATAVGDFTGEVNGKQSVGATLEGDDPATFSVGEMFVFGRAPLSPEELEKIRQYLQEKWAIGGRDS